MPFDFATFQRMLLASNASFSNWKTSSFGPLTDRLKAIGPALGPPHQAEIQLLYGTIPAAKQTQYVNAANYLKQCLPGLADAIPWKPHMHYRSFRVLFADHAGIARYPMRLYHVHELTWKSSNGDVSSLRNVGTRESVTHRTNPAGPPFNAVLNGGIPMHFTQGATSANGSQTCSNFDDHSVGNPTLLVRHPVGEGSVIADQVYQYTTDGVSWFPIPDTEFELEKGVRRSGNKFVFFFRKQNSGNNKTKFHFEVEYPIGAQLPLPQGNRIPVFPAGFAEAADIRNFASRIVKLG